MYQIPTSTNLKKNPNIEFQKNLNLKPPESENDINSKPRVIKIQRTQTRNISKYRNLRVPKSQSHTISNSRNIKIPETQIPKNSKTENLKIPDTQHIETLIISKIQISEYTNSKISKYEKFTISKCKTIKL